MATTTKAITCCVFFFALYFNRISGVGSKNIVILDSLNSKELCHSHLFFLSKFVVMDSARQSSL